MSDPREQQREPDELELESEAVKDLEPDPEDADEIRGGRCTCSPDMIQSQTL